MLGTVGTSPQTACLDGRNSDQRLSDIITYLDHQTARHCSPMKPLQPGASRERYVLPGSLGSIRSR
jgi:hypothetical protein